MAKMYLLDYYCTSPIKLLLYQTSYLFIFLNGFDIKYYYHNQYYVGLDYKAITDGGEYTKITPGNFSTSVMINFN